MTITTAVMANLIGPTWFQVILVGSQVALSASVVVLLAIWWVEWRNGRCLLYTSPSPRDATLSRMPSSA